MSRATFAAVSLIPLLSGGADLSARHFKETAEVQITAPAGNQPQRFIIIAKGIHVYRKLLPFSRQFSGALITRDTLTAPALLSLFGVGEVEVVAVDPAVKYTARLERLTGGLNEAKIATGSHIAISHHSPGEQFAIRTVDASKR
jgi:hypothetical protein